MGGERLGARDVSPYTRVPRGCKDVERTIAEARLPSHPRGAARCSRLENWLAAIVSSYAMPSARSRSTPRRREKMRGDPIDRIDTCTGSRPDHRITPCCAHGEPLAFNFARRLRRFRSCSASELLRGCNIRRLRRYIRLNTYRCEEKKPHPVDQSKDAKKP